MKPFFLYLLPLFLLQGACKKDSSDYSAFAKNNVFNATVLLTSGSTVNVTAKGMDVSIGCGLLGGGTFVDASDASKAAIYLTVYANNFMCVTAPGTYSLSNCEYRVNTQSYTAPIYLSFGASKPGTITFTQVDAKHMEGFFNVVCYYQSDSVVINGTFKGNAR